MFRKPKKNGNAKAGLRRKRAGKDEEDNNSVGEANESQEADDTLQELAEARKRATAMDSNKRFRANVTVGDAGSSAAASKEKAAVMHHFESSTDGPVSQKDLATRTNQHHPTKTVDRGNKFLAGPIKAPTNIRTTCRFDYQPDVCKDYKDTGFCGFGDSCIYAHIRGDTLSGWQIEQKWQQEQEAKKKKQQEEMDAFMSGKKKKDETTTVDDDGLPFACHLCRQHFTDPIVTNCGHYFCQACLLQHVKDSSNLCPVCNKDTHGVFHEPAKLLSKKRKLSGRDSSWKEFQEECQKGMNNDGSDDEVQ